MGKENHPPSFQDHKYLQSNNQKRKRKKSMMENYLATLFTERSPKKSKITIKNKTKAKDKIELYSSEFPITPTPFPEPIISPSNKPLISKALYIALE